MFSIVLASTTPPLPALYSGSLTTNSPIFYRPQSLTNDYHYFQAIQVTVPTTGTYTFKSSSSIDTRGYIYRTYFDPSDASTNFMLDNDDGAGQLQFSLQASLDAGQQYVLVVTTHRAQITGAFSVLGGGPGQPQLVGIIPTTSRPITTSKFCINIVYMIRHCVFEGNLTK